MHSVQDFGVRAGHACIRVAVDRPDGSGKSTFADELAAATRALHRPVVRVSLDDFHNIRAVRLVKHADEEQSDCDLS